MISSVIYDHGPVLVYGWSVSLPKNVFRLNRAVPSCSQRTVSVRQSMVVLPGPSVWTPPLPPLINYAWSACTTIIFWYLMCHQNVEKYLLRHGSPLFFSSGSLRILFTVGYLDRRTYTTLSMNWHRIDTGGGGDIVSIQYWLLGYAVDSNFVLHIESIA
jgi:hypothetical protein